MSIRRERTSPIPKQKRVEDYTLSGTNGNGRKTPNHIKYPPLYKRPSFEGAPMNGNCLVSKLPKELRPTAGRPTVYNDTIPNRAYKMIVSCGAKEEDLAIAFGVTPNIINEWKEQHEDFRRAIREAHLNFETTEIVKALGAKARGFTIPEEKVFIGPGGEPIRVETTRYYPPDTAASIFWLCNHSRRNGNQDWMQVSRVEQTGKDGGPIEHAKLHLHLTVADILKNTDVSTLRGLRSLIDGMGPKPVNGESLPQ